MIQSFIFSEGRHVGSDLEIEALRLVRADKGFILWVDLDNPTDEEIKQVLEGVFQFHPLASEDCVTDSPLPKIEDYDDYLFLVTHAVDFTRTEKFNTTEFDLFLGKDYLVTVHRKSLRSVQRVIERCLKNSGTARAPGRIAHLLLGTLVDNYKPVTDELRTELEEIEEAVLGTETGVITAQLMQVRGEINLLRQIVRPQRDVVGRLARGDNKLIRSVLLPHLRGLRDNLLRIDETAANYADQLLISFDLYLSKSSFQANDGIKALTALTAISLPATVVGSWYGMNYKNMPELSWRYGYLVCALVTITLTAITWRWCKRKKWL